MSKPRYKVHFKAVWTTRRFRGWSFLTLGTRSEEVFKKWQKISNPHIYFQKIFSPIFLEEIFSYPHNDYTNFNTTYIANAYFFLKKNSSLHIFVWNFFKPTYFFRKKFWTPIIAPPTGSQKKKGHQIDLKFYIGDRYSMYNWKI